MAMEITSNYNNYAAGYTKSSSKVGNANGSVDQKAQVKQESPATNNTTNAKSSGMDYLQSLQDKYSGTAFAVGTVSRGQTYGNSSDINFVINSNFVSKLGADPEKQKRFEEDVEYLTNFTKKFKEQQAANGWNVENCGWFCDKDGNWGGWCVLKKTDEKSFLQKMQDKSDEIKEEKNAKKLEQKKLEEKKKSEISNEETATDTANHLLEDKKSASKDGVIYFDSSDIQTFIEAAKEDSEEKVSAREQQKVGANIDLQV